MSPKRVGSLTSVACAQLAPDIGELDRNRAAATAAIEAAAASGARLVVLPELCISGYAFSDVAEARTCAEPADGPTIRAWRELAARHDLVIVGGFCERGERNAVYNSAAVVDAIGTRAVYRKTHLWDREQEIFAAGGEPPPVVPTTVGTVGIAICYDSFFPEVMRDLALGGADVIAVPMNSPVGEPLLEPPIEVVLACAAAHVNRVFVAQADRAGQERGIDWAEASVIVAPDGALLTEPCHGRGIVSADCALQMARDKSLGERNDVLGDRRPEFYGGLAASPPKPKEILL